MAGEKRLAVAHVSLSRGYRGHERQIELLIKELSNLGVPQALVCRDDSPLPFHLEGVRNLTFIKVVGFSDPRFGAHFKVGNSYTLVHAHDSMAMQWALVHYILRGTRYVLTIREDDLTLSGFMTKAACKSAAAIASPAREISEYLADVYQREVITITDCASRMEPNKKLVTNFRKSLNGRFVVGNIAPLVNRQMGQSVLIDAARLLQSEMPELVVVFVGGGDDINLLRHHARDMKNVKFVGFRLNYVDYLKVCDVFVYPVNTISNCSIVLDAMEHGVPVIASNVGGIPDLIKDVTTGFLVEPGDAESIAEYIKALKEDRDLYHTLVANGRNEAELHSSAAMAAEYYRNYITIINKP